MRFGNGICIFRQLSKSLTRSNKSRFGESCNRNCFEQKKDVIPSSILSALSVVASSILAQYIHIPPTAASDALDSRQCRCYSEPPDQSSRKKIIFCRHAARVLVDAATFVHLQSSSIQQIKNLAQSKQKQEKRTEKHFVKILPDDHQLISTPKNR